MNAEKIIFVSIISILLLSTSCNPYNAEKGYKFDFGTGKPQKGFLKVTPDLFYSETDTFGFLGENLLQAEKLSGSDNKDSDFIGSAKPFIFIADVPEGNYDVKVSLVGMEGGSKVAIKTESRRLIVMDLEISEGKTKLIQFTTNVRRPEISKGNEVRRKPREYGHFNWDHSLSIEFNGVKPAVSSIEISRNETAITLFLAGNSTVTDQRYEPYSAWGQMLPAFFKPGLVSVANHAESGETLKSFVGEKRLKKLFSQVQPGDYLFIQFAHNDQKKNSSTYSPPFTDYQEYLRRFISTAQELGVNPVLVTPMLRRKFDKDGHVVNTHGDYPEAMRQVAGSENVPLIDLTEMSKVLYEALGTEDSKDLFLHFPLGSFPGQKKALKDNSHQSTYGAFELAHCVVKSIQQKLPDLTEYLLDDIPDYDPAAPNPFHSWDLPLSPSFDLTTPEGS